MLRVLLVLVLVEAVWTKDTCPPPCEPPRGLPACQVYKMAADCSNGWRDIQISSVACGCMWKEYIDDLQHSDKITNECYIWSLRTCTMEESEKLAASNAAAPKEILAKVLALEKAQGLVKHRRRSGVGISNSNSKSEDDLGPLDLGSDAHSGPETFNVNGKMEKKEGKKGNSIYGSIDRGATAKKGPGVKDKGKRPGSPKRVNLERRLPTRKPQPMHPQLLGGGANDVRNGDVPWLSFGMKDDRFRLFVMGVLFLVNTIFFIVAASCKFDQKAETKETRPAGDLDPYTYRRRSDRNNNYNPGFIESMIGKLRPQDEMAYQEYYLPPFGAITRKTRESSERGAHGGSQRGRSRGLYNQVEDLENLISTEYEGGRQARVRTASTSSSRQKHRANKSANHDGGKSKSSHSTQSLRGIHNAMAEFQQPPQLLMPTIDSFKRHPAAPRTSSP